VDYQALQDTYASISRFVEKPTLSESPSNLGVVGKYILTQNIWQTLKTTSPGADGEIR